MVRAVDLALDSFVARIGVSNLKGWQI